MIRPGRTGIFISKFSVRIPLAISQPKQEGIYRKGIAHRSDLTVVNPSMWSTFPTDSIPSVQYLRAFPKVSKGSRMT